MADQVFEILLKITGDAQKAKDASREFERLGLTAKEAGNVGVKAQQEVGESLKKTTGLLDKAKAAAKGLTFEFPVIGRIAQFALNPVSLAVAAIGTGVAVLVQHLRNVAKAAEDAAVKLEGMQFAKLDALRDSASTAATELAKLNEQLDRAKELPYDDAIKAGAVSPLDELTRRRQLQPDLEASAQSNVAAVAALGSNPELVAAVKQLADAESKRAELTKAVRDAEKVRPLEGLQAFDEWGNVIGPADQAEKLRAARVAAAQRAFAANEQTITASQATIDAFGVRRVQLEGAAQSTSAAAIANAAQITQLNKAVGGEALADSNLLTQAAAGADVLQAGGRATKEQSTAINQLIRALGLTELTNKQVIDIIGRFNDNQENFKQALMQLENRVNIQSHRM